MGIDAQSYPSIQCFREFTTIIKFTWLDGKGGKGYKNSDNKFPTIFLKSTMLNLVRGCRKSIQWCLTRDRSSVVTVHPNHMVAHS